MRPSGRRSAAAAFVACLALSVLWTWPLAAHLSSRIPHDPGDPVFGVWLLWWNAQAMPFTDSWWSPPVLYPMAGALALSEHLAGIGLVTTPLQALGASALTGYNAAFLLSFALSGFFAWLLVWRLVDTPGDRGRRHLAAACAGLVYGFGPYRAGQLAHLQVLTSQWMPLALVAMHAYLGDGRRRWLSLFAVAWLVQALSNGYYLLFFPVLVVLWLAWFVDWRRAPARGVALAATFAASSLLLVPVLLKYLTVQRGLGLVRTPGEMVLFSAKPDSFLHASGMLALWPSVQTLTTEESLFPGVTALILLVAAGAAAAVRRWRAQPAESAPHSAGTQPRIDAGRPLVFYAGATLIMWGLALGPVPPDSAWPVWLRPYSLLTLLPGFDAIRVPARFAMLATLCLGTAAGLAFARVAPRRGAWRRIIATAAIVGLLADGWMRAMPLAMPPGRVVLPDIPNAVVLELPVNEGAVDVAAMYRSMFHRHPIANGYSGYTTPQYAILSLALRRGDPSVITELGRLRPLIIIVNQAFDPDGDLLHLVRGLPGIEPVGGSSAGTMFTLPALPAGRVAPIGEPWPASVRDAANNSLEIDLGEPRVVRTVGFSLRWFFADLNRRIAVEASLDGTTWMTVWEDWTGGPALAAAIRSPLEAPVRLAIADAPARYLRVHPVPPWMRDAIRVYGPR